MDLKDRLTMVIHSCDKYSDLWDAHVSQLEKYWPDRGINTFIVTDKHNPRDYQNVEILATGDGKELSERTQVMLSEIDTEYVFVTLDDYFLIKPVSNEVISNLLDMMDREQFDYLRLYIHPKCKRSARLKEYGKVYRIDTNVRYSVNLYVGIWRKSFLEKTIREPRDAWRYEVSLSRIAREVGARCAMSNNSEFVILDVVRKGKILNKANRYLKKHKIYNGTRPVISRWYEVKLWIRTWGVRLAPKFVSDAARNFMIRRGHHYYSQDE